MNFLANPIALEHVILVTVSRLVLLQEGPLGLQNLILLLQALDLIEEGSKLLVEALDLFLFLVAHGLDTGDHCQLQGAQQAMVHCDGSDAPHTPRPTAWPDSCWCPDQPGSPCPHGKWLRS